jgi:hypothetical protein
LAENQSETTRNQKGGKEEKYDIVEKSPSVRQKKKRGRDREGPRSSKARNTGNTTPNKDSRARRALERLKYRFRNLVPSK